MSRSKRLRGRYAAPRLATKMNEKDIRALAEEAAKSIKTEKDLSDFSAML